MRKNKNSWIVGIWIVSTTDCTLCKSTALLASKCIWQSVCLVLFDFYLSRSGRENRLWSTYFSIKMLLVYRFFNQQPTKIWKVWGNSTKPEVFMISNKGRSLVSQAKVKIAISLLTSWEFDGNHRYRSRISYNQWVILGEHLELWLSLWMSTLYTVQLIL